MFLYELITLMLEASRHKNEENWHTFETVPRGHNVFCFIFTAYLAADRVAPPPLVYHQGFDSCSRRIGVVRLFEWL